jgi:hypothetical protein
MGKSEFLEKDLIPAAHDKGYLTAYLNLWDARTAPTQALVGLLGRTFEPKGWAKLAKRLKRPIKSVKASATLKGLAEGSLEAELDNVEASVVRPALSELIRDFDKPGRRLLLVLDEAQVLAEPPHSDLAHALRASLDGRKQTIKVVFAGSSEVTLRRMFGRSNEPFYNWAPLEPFELLGPDFVKAMTVLVNRLSRYPLAQMEALAAFEALRRTPEFFRRYLNRYLAYAQLGSRAALEDTLAHVFNDKNFATAWTELLPADREVLKLIIEGVTDLFSQATRRRLSRSLGLAKVVGHNTPQKALHRLQMREIVVRMDRGEYRVQDDAFAEWLHNQEFDT